MSNRNAFVIPAPTLVAVPVAGSDALFPVRRIYCVGRNYADHVREMGGDERDPPFFFQKPTDAIVWNDAKVPYPPFTNDFQHEVELVLVIGVGGSAIPVHQAAEHVFGIAAGIDLTRRDVQIQARKTGRPWEIGKSFDQSAPCGVITPLNGGPLPTRGKIELKVNGVVKQSADIEAMIWSCSEIISRLSEQYRLVPGDLIYTGTPAGIGPIGPGDEIEAYVEGTEALKVEVIPA